MIKLTAGQIREPAFNETVQRLRQIKMPLVTARHLQKIIAAIFEEQKNHDLLFNDLSEKYLEPIPSQPQNARIKLSFTDEERKEAEAAIQEFLTLPIEINLAPLSDRDLMMGRLSAIDLEVLAGLVDAD